MERRKEEDALLASYQGEAGHADDHTVLSSWFWAGEGGQPPALLSVRSHMALQ